MIRAEKIHKIYKNGKKDLRVLQDIDLEIKKGEALAIVGPSGAGKSTLLHILGGIDRPSSGRVVFGSQDLYKLPDAKRAFLRNQNIGFVFQFYHLLPEFTALENAMMPALMAQGSRLKTQDIRNRVEDLLQELGLGERLRHRPSELSGGEQQRVAIGRALINDPDILLCDEPTGNLDSKMGEEILDILLRLNKKNNTTIAIVTHDKEIAKRTNRVVEIRDGRIL
ncbi:ABC transporter ATP-binding protein [Candidatus Omnitrophota bacterium]